MSAENSREVGRKLSLGLEASSRKEALERLKATRKGGLRNGGGGCEIRLQKPIFDTVGDEEYQSLVSRRREEDRGFVVDDGDLGYVDEGEEEDWSKPSGGAESTDESDDYGGRLQRRKTAKKKKTLKGAASITGEGRLSSMFTCSSFNKGKETTDKVKCCESILDEVLAEFTPDDMDRERHKRRKQSATVNKKYLVHDSPSIVTMEKEQVVTEFEVIPPSDANEVFTLNAAIDMKDKDTPLSANAGWKEAMCTGGTENEVPLASGSDSECQTEEFDLEADGSLLFYILDACEKPFDASMGTIYLFGKVKVTLFYSLVLLSCSSSGLIVDTLSGQLFVNRPFKDTAKPGQPNDIPKMFQSSKTLVELIECGETDAWLSMELMFHLNVLPLTLQLTNISGNLWGKTLQGGSAQRNELVLRHTYHWKKFILPDKISPHMKERTSHNVDDPSKGNKTKKGPAYAGGLVWSQRKAYMTNMCCFSISVVFTLSIIQEYNICFTTIPRSEDGVPRLPSSQTPGILPKLMEHLVSIRKCVKLKMKKETDLKCRELDIRQKALKLTANSLYGYLGFSNSRFYAKPLAELITLQGREILQRTVDLVQNHLNLEVIYGDTDSIMIHSGLDNIKEVKAIGAKVIQEVNKKYRCLKIELDCIYKRMLLLRKKKYAAIKLQFKDGKICEDIERKGVDMVRRDWSLLSKEIGDLCLAKILYGGMRQRGYKKGFSAKDTVPYIICYEQGSTSLASSAGIAERARHPDEVKSDDNRWLVDIDYYLSQQIHPVVSRLCAEIQGTSPERLAECLGLDPSKYRSRSNVTTCSDPSTSLLCATSYEERYKSCEPLALACPSCSAAFNCPSITTSVCASISNKSETEESDSIFWLKLRCPKCEAEGSTRRISPAMIANQCDDESCKYTTRSPNFRLLGDCERGTVCPNYPNCRGTLLRKYTEADLYRQLSYFCHILDTQCSLEKVSTFNLIASNQMDVGVRIQVEKAMTKIRPAVESAASMARSIRDRCGYGWLQLTDIAI
ncbi:hypothetical protein ARALYDRAFT_359258 [Arabidopsis lyrata subsp. lyrata]|uniref:DNA polymerase n=1 Tax=Arabidopsis lyrata subsp. lyrata TaxID=81972 RepID=D7MW76_ARALL|nr:hypothetical protein ARALYDRAFT_359258 [Arabidopsis lyrata subsp. lyrata]